MPTPNPPPWDSDDAARLKEFLSSHTGQRMLVILMTELRPGFLDGTHQIKTLVRAGEIKGYERALGDLTLLTVFNPTEETPTGSANYPALDDDKQWSDGKSPTP